MTDDVTRRPWWRWIDGVRYRLSARNPWCRYEGSDASDTFGQQVTEAPPDRRSPIAEVDPTDAATLGCLLALAREVTGDPAAYLVRIRHGDGLWWVLVSGDGCVLGDRRPDEWSALVAACDAAWGAR